MSDNPINLVTGIFRDKVIDIKKALFPGNIEINHLFSLQHNCVRGRLSDAAGQVTLETRVGQNKMGGRLHQLVSSHEDQAHHHRPLPWREGGEHGPLSDAQVS